uniref:Uncharacterized protein n=1 Tax=Populus trichocarpa TaxID=3694 RepID=A0A2K1YCP4_POPTR|eukprot:XP_002318892.3 uncharacterized protein LOC7453985 [Populus trichocarpa]
MTHRFNNYKNRRSLQVTGNRRRRTWVRFFEMEESSSSFPEIFNAKKSTLCVHNAEIEITSDKCLIRGQAAFLGEDCPRGISIRSFSENGVKCTDFVIPREVHVVEAATRRVAHRATSPRHSDSSFQHNPKKPHKKKQSKQASLE